MPSFIHTLTIYTIGESQSSLTLLYLGDPWWSCLCLPFQPHLLINPACTLSFSSHKLLCFLSCMHQAPLAVLPLLRLYSLLGDGREKNEEPDCFPLLIKHQLQDEVHAPWHRWKDFVNWLLLATYPASSLTVLSFRSLLDFILSVDIFSTYYVKDIFIFIYKDI